MTQLQRAIKRPKAIHVLPLTPVAEHCPVDALPGARNLPQRLPVDPAQGGRIVNILMARAEHELSGGFHQHRSGHTAETLKQGKKVSTHTVVYTVKRAVTGGNDVAPVMTEFEDTMASEVNDGA